MRLSLQHPPFPTGTVEVAPPPTSAPPPPFLTVVWWGSSFSHAALSPPGTDRAVQAAVTLGQCHRYVARALNQGRIDGRVQGLGGGG